MPSIPHAPGQGANPAAHLSGARLGRHLADLVAARTDEIAVDKTAVLVAFSNALAWLGLPPLAARLGQTLIRLASDDDWKKGKPFAWPKTKTLVRDYGVDKRQVSRAITQLENRGILVRRYGGNGHRYRVENAEGHVIAQSGLDLSPLIALAPMWQAEKIERDAARDARQSVCRALTARRREVHRRADRLVGFADDEPVEEIVEYVEMRFEGRNTTDKLDRSALDLDHLRDVLEDAERDLDAIEDAVLETYELTEESPMDDSTVTLQTRPLQTPSPSTQKEDDEHGEAKSSIKERARSTPETITGVLLREACPAFCEFAQDFGVMEPGGRMNLAALGVVADGVRPALRIDNRLWATAQNTLGGKTQAAMLIAYVYEKRHSEIDAVRLKDPEGSGGYMRRCVDRAATGELRLKLSLIGMRRLAQRRQVGAFTARRI